MSGGREEKTQRILEVFVESFQEVQVDTPVGSVSGRLKQADRSEHGGIGCLLLLTRDGWLLVRAWIAIKRRV